MASSSFPSILFLAHVLLLCGVCSHLTKAQSYPLVDGLSQSFYDSTCPKLESIVRKQLKKVFEKDIGLAAGLLRLHFHDCFVQGCDGSVLLDGSTSGPSEQSAVPNLSLRPEVFVIINDLSRRVRQSCGLVVSCSDLVALAARDSVYLSGGPNYSVPLGRRDSLNFATLNVTLANLPSPFSNASTLIKFFATKNLKPVDLVALSGGHTIGRGHCPTFTNRLYPTQDPVMDKTFANNLKKVCPVSNSTNFTSLDLRSPNQFDHKYFVDLVNRQGLFTSDQDLYTDKQTKDIVKSFALDKELFFDKFVDAIIKMGQFSVLTGTKGEIRTNCSARNGDSLLMSTFMEDEEAGLLEF